jgi:hypothetical protein
MQAQAQVPVFIYASINFDGNINGCWQRKQIIHHHSRGGGAADACANAASFPHQNHRHPIVNSYHHTISFNKQTISNNIQNP